MRNIKEAVARAASKSKATRPGTRSLVAEVDEHLEVILAARAAGTAMKAMAAEIGVPAARFIGRLLDSDDGNEAVAIAGEKTVERYTLTINQNGERTSSWPRIIEPVYPRSKFAKLGRFRRGVRMLYVGRDVVAQLALPFLPGIKVDEKEVD